MVALTHFAFNFLSLHFKLSLANLISYLTSHENSGAIFKGLVSKQNHLRQDGFGNFAFLVLGLILLVFSKYDFYFFVSAWLFPY